MSGICLEFKDGFKVDFGATKIPNRKQVALYSMRGANTDILGYFTSEENADKFSRMLDMIIERLQK